MVKQLAALKVLIALSRVFKNFALINWQRVSATRLVQRVHTVTRTMDSVSVDETSEEEIVVAVSTDTTIIRHAKVEYKLIL